MKLKLTVNIGTDDNKRLKLPSLAEGDVVETSKAVGDALLRLAWAVPADEPAPAGGRKAPQG